MIARLVCGACILALTAGTAAAQEQIALGAAATGSAGYNYGAGVAQVVNSNQNELAVSIQATAGFGENMVLLSDGDIPIALSSMGTLLEAYRGDGTFQQTGALEGLRWVTGIAAAAWHCVARADSGITAFSDLVGRRVNLNPVQTSTRLTNDALMRAAGVSLESIEVFELSTGQVFEALQNRVIDASCNGYSVGHAQLTALASRLDLVILPVSDELFDEVSILSKGSIARYEIPAGSYRGIDQAIPTFSDLIALTSHENVSDDLIYRFTKILWENVETLAENELFVGLELSPAMAGGTGAVPVHDGALRYYEQVGAQLPAQ